jgi:aminoglycoside phosphotransferase (APT) family kinase protein
LAGDIVLVPEVFFVDGQEMAFAMSDVGEERQVLFTVIGADFELLTEQAEALGHALGKVHSATRNSALLRPPEEEAIIRKVIFEGLLAPGAQRVFPQQWGAVSSEMQSQRECLIHGDLWSKNLLVRRGAPIALVDFEGVCHGDPAFDLGTLISVALLPALENSALLPQALAFAERLLQAWKSIGTNEDWARPVLPRTLRATACFLASRAYGPFAYSFSEEARQRISGLALSLVSGPAPSWQTFQTEVSRCNFGPPSTSVGQRSSV